MSKFGSIFWNVPLIYYPLPDLTIFLPQTPNPEKVRRGAHLRLGLHIFLSIVFLVQFRLQQIKASYITNTIFDYQICIKGKSGSLEYHGKYTVNVQYFRKKAPVNVQYFKILNPWEPC